MIRVKVRLHLGLASITYKGKVAKIRYLEKLYNKVDDDTCLLCGKEKEDVYHIMFQCVLYEPEREKYLKMMTNFKNTYNNSDYVQMFNKLNKTDSLKLMYFFNSACQRRLIYLSEIDLCEVI